MTQTAVRAQERLTDDSADADPGPRTEFPRHRSVTAHVTDGLDGVLKVAMMLRGRRYRIRELSVDVREGVVESVFTCTIALNAADTEVLIERLLRVPVVVAAHCR